MALCVASACPLSKPPSATIVRFSVSIERFLSYDPRCVLPMMAIIENFDGSLLGSRGINSSIFSCPLKFPRQLAKIRFLSVMASLSFKTRKLSIHNLCFTRL